MKIVVIGGTGLIGSQVVKQLQNSGNEVIAASPNSGVNTLTGEGLNEALQGASVVVDVSNSPSFDDEPVMHFFKTSNENLLPAEKRAGVQHHIALSVVGTQKLQASGYFRAKQVQEDLIKASGIPYNIVHATQFFEFAGGVLQMSIADGKVILPDANIQPIASKDVALFVAQTALAQPANKILEIGGPEKFEMTAWIKKYAEATHKNYEIIPDKKALYSGAPLDADTLAPENPVFLGKAHYADWIAVPENQR
ncbi:SDR family oxidoreductase [Mucilaginibacter sp. L3T2-6]|uniref:SDR family oxidoreductase n=1 Tax=Mucilaginibacter sp. L3T2-6 TaxID=3062491 RepID=UPI00267615B0|nr:SDR family oxidoreductase [Mucilaginibacter sp. L3T2-6]MDO3642811.1 SDR family oxidoreductase [Mucilaginibacter sp. L3T2-6]MDV6215460.1 SDR family oxidoreductase [Mucilaginibacter sp. L3T2-6]